MTEKNPLAPDLAQKVDDVAVKRLTVSFSITWIKFPILVTHLVEMAIYFGSLAFRVDA